MSNPAPPDPAPVLDLREAFRRSQAMFATLELGAFDRVATGPVATPELARDLGADPNALARLLDGCVASVCWRATGRATPTPRPPCGWLPPGCATCGPAGRGHRRRGDGGGRGRDFLHYFRAEKWPRLRAGHTERRQERAK
jgi:hypothetical protein